MYCIARYLETNQPGPQGVLQAHLKMRSIRILGSTSGPITHPQDVALHIPTHPNTRRVRIPGRIKCMGAIEHSGDPDANNMTVIESCYFMTQ